MDLKGVDPKSFSISRDKNNVPSTVSDKRPNKRRKTQDEIYNVSVSNPYEILSDIDSDQEAAVEIKKHESRENKFQPPPIVIYSYLQNHVKSVNKIKESLTQEVVIKYRANRLILQTKNINDYNKVKNVIHEANLEFHTYTPREDKDHKLVLKNLPPTITEDEVRDDLVAKKLLIKKVSQITKKSSDNKITRLPLYIVTADNKTNIKEILNIKIVCYCVITWERYKSKDGITQCYKCQSYDHIAKNCFKSEKCLICAGPHNRKDCEKNNSGSYKCANCGKNHLANDKNCEKYLKKVALKQANKLHTTVRQTWRNTSYQLRHQDFPQLVSSDKTAAPQPDIWPLPPQAPQLTNTDKSQNNISELFGMLKSFFSNFNISEMINTIKSALVKLATAPDNMSKLGIMVEIIMELFG